ncbi:MAG: DUF2098 domain-containing protein [Methanosarcinaceae archaeon]|nr:DUF2098 domain-containing protein [Methanosarcinaceae archaeon]
MHLLKGLQPLVNYAVRSHRIENGQVSILFVPSFHIVERGVSLVEETDTPNASDIHGNQIEPGTVVRYINTGTIGRVAGIRTDDEGVWALVDSTGLYYKVETLVVTDASELKEKVETRKTASEAKEYMRQYATSDADLEDVGQITGGG